MANTKAGGAKTAATNKRKYGDDFYKKIGAIGGEVSHPNGVKKEATNENK